MSQENCCVIAPAGKAFEEVYHYAIAPAFSERNMTSHLSHPEGFGGDLFAMSMTRIFKADMILADLTGFDSTVLYQMGVATGLMKPILMITQSGDELPMGLKNYAPIIYNPGSWQGAADLKKHIGNGIEAIGMGKDAHNPLSALLREELKSGAGTSSTKIRSDMENALREKEEMRSVLDGMKEDMKTALKTLSEEKSRNHNMMTEKDRIIERLKNELSQIRE